MNAPSFEHTIGITVYFTSSSGIGGKLRFLPEDFHVSELFLHPPQNNNGPFTIAEVQARNWETHTLVHELAEALHVSQRRISFAGTKDKRAVSTQLMSFDHITLEQLAALHIKEVTIKGMYSSNIPVRLGDLLGNRFEIRVRNISPEVTPEHLITLLAPIQSIGGFPNFYGIQRFGIIRPITHIVGRHIITGDFEHAVMTYVAHPLKGEPADTFALREELQQTHDYQKAFHTYPSSLNFEKAILNSLIQNPTDFTTAIQELPKNLLLMFINAYQSYLFNKMLSERLQRHIPLHEALLGDVILPLRSTSPSDQYIHVTTGNIDKVNTQISKKKAVVTGLLIGSDSELAHGEMGEIEQQILKEEHCDPRDFIIPEIPYLSSSGSRRAILADLPSIDWSLTPDDHHTEKQMLTLRFDLLKGCYATSLLREIMKSSHSKDY